MDAVNLTAEVSGRPRDRRGPLRGHGPAVAPDGEDTTGRPAHVLPPAEWARRLIVYGRLADLGLPLFAGRLDDEALQPGQEEIKEFLARHPQLRGRVPRAA